MVFVQVERATHKHTRIASTNTEKSIKLNDMIGDIPKRYFFFFLPSLYTDFAIICS